MNKITIISDPRPCCACLIPFETIFICHSSIHTHSTSEHQIILTKQLRISNIINLR